MEVGNVVVCVIYASVLFTLGNNLINKTLETFVLHIYITWSLFSLLAALVSHLSPVTVALLTTFSL